MHKLGVNYFEPWNIPAEDCVRLYRDIGFDAMFTCYYGDTAAMKPFAEACAKHGLWYECIHAPFGHMNDIWLPGERGDAMLRELTDCVKTCGELGVPKAVIHLSSGDHPPCVNDLGHARYDRLVETAVKSGVTLAFENQRKLANLAFVFELYEDVPQVRFCWDLGHEACFAYGREFMPLFGDKLVYTHIHDNLQVHDGDLHMLPFDGSIDFARRAYHLREHNYQGTLTLECLPDHSDRYPDVTPEEFYRRAYQAVSRFRDLVEA